MLWVLFFVLFVLSNEWIGVIDGLVSRLGFLVLELLYLLLFFCELFGEGLFVL